MKVERLIEGLSPEKDFLQQVLREVRSLLAAGNKRKNLIENKIIRYVTATLFSCFDGISMTIRDESKLCKLYRGFETFLLCPTAEGQNILIKRTQHKQSSSSLLTSQK